MPLTNLTEQAKILGDKVGGLALAVEHLDRRTGRNERVQMWVVFGLLLDLVLSIAVALVVTNQITVNNDIKAAVAREATTRNDGICPLYSLIIGSYNPGSRAEGKDRDAYVAAYKTMGDAYRSLECRADPVPPRADQTPVPVPR